MSNSQAIGTIKVVSARGWLHWAAYAAVGWSVVYAVLGIYGLASRTGFPLGPAAGPDSLGPLVGRFGAGLAWVVIIMAGIPAAALGAAMLRGVRRGALRPLFIACGVLLAGILLLLMIGLELLIALGYVPITLFKVLTGGDASFYLKAFVQWTVAHQLLCLIGGFLWLGATVSYARRSADACLSCGRRDGPEGWQGPDRAARWGRVAVYVAMVAPIFYTFTRYAWALGWPLGMTQGYWRAGQEKGLWVAGLFLASFALLGALLMLGLVQRWGEVFPRWYRAWAGGGSRWRWQLPQRRSYPRWCW